MADLIFDKLPYHMGIGNIDLDTDTFKIALLTSSYTPDSTDEVFTDVSTYETNATNYTAGGETLANVSVTETSGTTKFDADDVTWVNLTGTNIRYAVVYDTSSSDRLVCLLDFGTARSPSSENLKLTFNTGGIFDMKEAA